MKVRKDFVTNSSSSSFIISKDDISREKLMEILLEIANKEATWFEDDEHYTDYNEIAYRYEIEEATREEPYDHDQDSWFYGSKSTLYTNHFIIKNNACIRYHWGVIEEVLGKYNIPYTCGYCD